MRTLIIIPAYNEVKNISSLIQQIKTLEINPDIVVINDASKDDTAEVVRQMGVKVLDLPVNLGIGGAVQTGYLYAYENNYDIAIQVDGDGQHDPSYLPELIKPILIGDADLVIGSRFLSKQGFQSSFSRRVGIRIIRMLLLIITGRKFTDPTSGFRACNRLIITKFAKYYPVDYPEPESLVSVGQEHLKITEVKVVMNERKSGSSSIKGFKPVYYMFKICFAIIIEWLKKNKRQI